eukprot:363616-Chlamydomonas_euryale.AAC.2
MVATWPLASSPTAHMVLTRRLEADVPLGNCGGVVEALATRRGRSSQGHRGRPTFVGSGVVEALAARRGRSSQGHRGRPTFVGSGVEEALAAGGRGIAAGVAPQVRAVLARTYTRNTSAHGEVSNDAVPCVKEGASSHLSKHAHHKHVDHESHDQHDHVLQAHVPAAAPPIMD